MLNMKLSLLIVALALICGCVSKSKSELRAYQAYSAGLRDAASSQQKPAVIVTGEVKNHSVNWAEGLTLAKALLAAEYQGLRDPHRIAITRGGQTYNINVRAFLTGGEDPPLEAGDQISVGR